MVVIISVIGEHPSAEPRVSVALSKGYIREEARACAWTALGLAARSLAVSAHFLYLRWE